MNYEYEYELWIIIKKLDEILFVFGVILIIIIP